jgi:hypothetical protein
MKKPVLSGNLTKKFFLSLLAGDYLVSNVMEAPGQPMFAQTIAPKDRREAQWKEIVAARANGRMCHVFASAKDYIAMSLEVPFANERN